MDEALSAAQSVFLVVGAGLAAFLLFAIILVAVRGLRGRRHMPSPPGSSRVYGRSRRRRRRRTAPVRGESSSSTSGPVG